MELNQEIANAITGLDLKLVTMVDDDDSHIGFELTTLEDEMIGVERKVLAEFYTEYDKLVVLNDDDLKNFSELFEKGQEMYEDLLVLIIKLAKSFNISMMEL